MFCCALPNVQGRASEGVELLGRAGVERLGRVGVAVACLLGHLV